MVVRAEIEQESGKYGIVDVGVEGVILRMFSHGRPETLGTIRVENGPYRYVFVVRRLAEWIDKGNDKEAQSGDQIPKDGDDKVQCGNGRSLADGKGCNNQVTNPLGLIVEYYWLWEVSGAPPRECIGYANNTRFPRWVSKKLSELYKKLREKQQSLEEREPNNSGLTEQQANQNKKTPDKQTLQVPTLEPKTVAELCKQSVMLAREIYLTTGNK